MEGSHKQVVQTDIGSAGYCDKVHGTFAVPQAPENGAEDIVGGNKGNTHKADGQIGRCSACRLLGR